jgi:O-antigen ligase
LLKKTVNFRLIIVCLAAASVGLSMAIISISKLLLLLGTLAVALLALRSGNRKPLELTRLTPLAVMLVLAAFAMSLLWTTGPSEDAFGSLAKYGKLLGIVAMMVMIRSRREAAFAMLALVGAQAFLMASSWLLYFHVPVPWATSDMALREFAVFSSYLDEGIMTAAAGAICWHFRTVAPGRHGKVVAMVLAAACMLNVFFVLSGRSGHMVAIALLSLAIMWELPRKFRPVVLLLPFLIGALLFAGSPKVRERLMGVKNDVQAFSAQDNRQTTSGGIRLGLWLTSIEIIREHPVIGTGVGSWSTEYNRMEHRKKADHPDAGSNFNPHQEYLLWGVQLGFSGLVLFLGLMLAVVVDASRMDKPAARAAQSTIAALAAACLFNSSIYDALIGDFFAITIGLLLAFGLHDKEQSAMAVNAAADSGIAGA